MKCFFLFTEKGISLDWITISQCKENTASTSIGKIFLNLRFYGPPSALMLGPKRVCDNMRNYIAFYYF